MKKIKSEAFSAERVPLDDHHYEGCKFKSCTFVYAGIGSIGLHNNTISPDCTFEFTGAAGDTVQTMRAIYGMGDWGRKHILATFQQIAPDIKNLH